MSMVNLKVKEVVFEKLEPGMILAKPIYDAQGQLILDEGVLLTSSYIKYLAVWEIDKVTVREYEKEELTSEHTKDSQRFRALYEEAFQAVQQSFEVVRQFKRLPYTHFQKIAFEMVLPIVSMPGVMANLFNVIKNHDDYTYKHSLNVAIICGLLGKWLENEEKVVQTFILTGLLHDIGKTQIPLDILNKPGKLSPAEFEVIKKHTILGYSLMQEATKAIPLPKKILLGILLHHERCDGSGYPRGLIHNKIPLVARIIAIADIYDAMVSERCYKEAVSPFEVVKVLTQEMFNKLDPTICTVFLNNVRNYLVGNIVELSTGKTAEVVYVPDANLRPLVRTGYGEFIDLEKEKGIAIKKVIS